MTLDYKGYPIAFDEKDGMFTVVTKSGSTKSDEKYSKIKSLIDTWTKRTNTFKPVQVLFREDYGRFYRKVTITSIAEDNGSCFIRDDETGKVEKIHSSDGFYQADADSLTHAERIITLNRQARKLSDEARAIERNLVNLNIRELNGCSKYGYED